MKRERWTFYGLVQGVGFRPFIFRGAVLYKLTGYVKNVGYGVLAEIQGDEQLIENFKNYINDNKPVNAIIEKIEKENIEVVPEEKDFLIIESEQNRINTIIPFDQAICSKCIEEFYDYSSRHYMNFFISCTDCGPRWTMIKKLPYDRENTTMAPFEFCNDCKDEYYKPSDRRFNAQSTTCEKCGPKYFIYSYVDKVLPNFNYNKEIFDFIAEKILEGKIIALKGIGGFHIIADPYNYLTVDRLINSKKREGKPLALVTNNILNIEKICYVSEYEKEMFYSNKSPIILFQLKSSFFKHVNGSLSTLGVMRSYTAALNYLLWKTDRDFLVATSANLSKIPMITDNKIAIEKLNNVVDYIVYHDREIYTRCDDTVMYFIDKKPIIIRNGRGVSPSYINIYTKCNHIILSLGANEKNTISLFYDNKIITSQYIGDLENKETIESFKSIINHFIKLYDIKPKLILHDKHEGYFSSQYAKLLSKEYDAKMFSVQHHIAHIYSAMLEHNLSDCIGFSFDGTGLGEDGAIWGSEAFVINKGEYKRVFHLEYYPLISGEKVIIEPIRLAYYLSTLIDKGFAEEYFSEYPMFDKLSILPNTIKIMKYPLSSSMGRLFDVVAVLLKLGYENKYEAMLPMKLESIAMQNEELYYEYLINLNNEYTVNIVDILQHIIKDIKNGLKVEQISAKFHNTIVKIIVDIAKLLKQNYNKSNIVLSGGVFQNKYLIKKCIYQLNKEGFKVFMNNLLPINDGGISAGQIYYYILKEGE